MNPTVCRACGGRISNPAPEKAVCDDCVREWGQGFEAMAKREDPSDLTQKLWRLPKKPEGDVAKNIIAFIGIGFWGCCFAVMLYWLGKQAGLWG